MTRTAAGAIVIAAATLSSAILPGRSASYPAPVTGKLLGAIDLTKPFATRSAWRFTLTQGPGIAHTDEGPIPGTITFCLKRAGARACSHEITELPEPVAPEDVSVLEPRYLYTARVVYPRGRAAAPLLLTRTGGSFGFDGSQPVFTQILAYRNASDRFERIFSQMTGRNRNQEIRFVDAGPLRGDVIVAEPAERSPWGYWMTVHRLETSYRYRQILRYRSATRYGDENPLAVIDSEMPNIRLHLGLWHPGQPLPLPAKGCAKPRLVKMELWCS